MIATLAVAFVGFASLRVGGELEGLVAIAAAGAWLAALWERRPRLSAGRWLTLQILFLVWMGAAGVLLGVRLLTLFAQLLVFVQVHRLLTRRSAGDDRYVHFIAFGQMLLGSVLTVDAVWFLLFCAFAVTLTWAMLLGRLAMAVEQDWLDRYGRGEERSVPASAMTAVDGVVRAPFLIGVTTLTILLLVGTVALFFVLPRMHAGLFSGGLLQSVHISGFDERVRLGEVGTMQLSNEPVMRVRVLDRAGRPYPHVALLYWHGLALDRFDGRAWELSDKRRTTLTLPSHRRFEGPPEDAGWTLEQRVSLEVLDRRVLFHVPRALGIYGDFRTLEAVETEGYYVPGPRSRLDYTVYSKPPEFESEVLRGLDPRDAPAILRSIYTQLPTDLSPRIRTLAQEWSRGSASPVDALLLIQERLRGPEFVYSLDQPASAYPDPLLAFVDEVREGHCEYFASALAVMARTLGYPTRVVNGFSGGDYNPVGEYWVVRGRHAHSWVEVWFPERGWTLFDPTPSSGIAAGGARLTLSARLRAWADYARVSWSAVLLDYEAGSQLEAIRGLARWMQDGGRLELPSLRRGALQRDRSGPGRVRARDLLVPSLLLSGLILGGVVLRRLRRTGRRDRRMEAASRAADRLVTTWRRAAERVGSDHPGSGGTTEAWAHWAERYDPSRWRGAVDEIERYEAARFGGGGVPDPRPLKRLRTSSRRGHRLDPGVSRW
jgi:transglutaminase-like putative cysteine protease